MESVLLQIKDQVAVITLNRPEKYNAINRDMALSLQKKLAEAEENAAVRCILLTGAGKAFSSGQDLTEIKDPSGPAMRKILPEQLNPIVSKLRSIQKPVVVAVNGIAAGAAANIALCCDMVIAGKSAVFIQAFSKIGLIPDSGGTYMLPRLVGLQKAIGWMMLGENVTAEEAERTGMIYKCVADDALMQQAESIAAHLAQMPTKALVYTRQAVEESLNTDFAGQLQNEARWQEKAAGTADFKEGVTAFVEKRKPAFRGK